MSQGKADKAGGDAQTPGAPVIRSSAALAAAMHAGPSNTDIELRLLMEAIYLRYSYDFRDYAGASQKRRVLQARWASSTARPSRSCRRACCTTRRYSTSCCST
jgi:hypothetical protein